MLEFRPRPARQNMRCFVPELAIPLWRLCNESFGFQGVGFSLGILLCGAKTNFQECLDFGSQLAPFLTPPFQSAPKPLNPNPLPFATKNSNQQSFDGLVLTNFCGYGRCTYEWLSKLGSPFWVPIIVWHLIFRGPKKGP